MSSLPICPYCAVHFTRQFNLQRHVERVHRQSLHDSDDDVSIDTRGFVEEMVSDPKEDDSQELAHERERNSVMKLRAQMIILNPRFPLTTVEIPCPATIHIRAIR